MNAKGKFVLIVSDEDRINRNAIPDILNIINGVGQLEISEIISGVAYIEEQDRYYVAPPKNKNQLLSPNKAKNIHYTNYYEVMYQDFYLIQKLRKIYTKTIYRHLKIQKCISIIHFGLSDGLD